MSGQLSKTIVNQALLCTDEEIQSLANLNEQWLVLYFYPKDCTSGCTIEAKEFSALKSAFAKHGCQLAGVSRDSIKSHHRFIEKENLNHPLISDPDEALCQYFDVMKEKNMYGRKYIGIERSTFLISPDGKIAQEWRKVKAPGHAQSVLDALNEVKD